MRPLVLLFALALAGCASAPSSPPTSTPSAAQASGITTPTPNATQDEVVFLYDEPFTNATREIAQSFSVARGHWLCVVTNLTAASGDALVALEGPQGSGWVTLATPQNASSDRMVPWIEGPFVVHLNLTGFTGRVALNVTNEA